MLHMRMLVAGMILSAHGTACAAPLHDTTVALAVQANAKTDDAARLKAAEEQLIRKDTLRNRRRVALILARPGTAFEDRKRAIRLLQEGLALKEDDNSEEPAMARDLLLILVGYEIKVRQASNEKGQRAELEKQIEELKHIDRDISKRAAPPPTLPVP